MSLDKQGKNRYVLTVFYLFLKDIHILNQNERLMVITSKLPMAVRTLNKHQFFGILNKLIYVRIL